MKKSWQAEMEQKVENELSVLGVTQRLHSLLMMITAIWSVIFLVAQEKKEKTINIYSVFS